MCCSWRQPAREKTVMYLDVLRRVLQPHQRALVIAHRKELIEQPEEKIRNSTNYPAMLTPGVVMAERNENDHILTIATVQSLTPKRLNELLSHGHIDYLVTDEAHHINAASYIALLTTLRDVNTNLKHLGVTATPFRSDDDGLGKVFTHVSDVITIADMVRDHWLVTPHWYGIKTDVSIAGVKSSQGDFIASQLAKRFDTAVFREKVVIPAYRKYADGRNAIAFTSSVGEALNLANAFRADGLTARIVTGTTPKAERTAIIQAFKAGKIKILVNCQVLTEGFDVPLCGCILMCRPTKSDTLYVQMSGRGLRPENGKARDDEECIILDFLPVETRNVVMAGDVLGVPKEVIERVIEQHADAPIGTAQASWRYKDGVCIADDVDFTLIAKELDYLKLNEKPIDLEALVRQWDSEGVTRSEMINRLSRKPYFALLPSLSPSKFIMSVLGKRWIVRTDQEWYEYIQNLKNSGLTIKQIYKKNNISKTVYGTRCISK